jgi:hypothetical protein
MKVKCKLVKELPDGSAIIMVDADAEAREMLIAHGFVGIVKEIVKQSKKYISKENVAKLTKTPAKKTRR